MIITKTIKLDNGVEFTANLNEEQVSYILSVGMNYLMQQGALPFAVVDDDSMADYPPTTGTAQ